MSVPMTLGYTAHAAPMQMAFYPGGSFPDEYAGDAFVSMRGSWNRDPASGYEVVRIRFDDGKPVKFEPFVSGFLSDGGKTHFARPVGLAVAADGALLMSDDANGVIYRIAGKSGLGAGRSTAAQPPVGPMEEQNAAGIGVPLALARKETTTSGSLRVSSESFAAGASIPAKHSEYFEGVSPALRWTPVQGAKSYAILVEDPDAKPVTPYVHWVSWNIPADVTALPEGLQEQPRLTEPEGLLQGANSRGSVGWYGPRPPPGDPPHHYHFQVLALDTVLELPPGTDRDRVLAAASGHVLAKGEVVGTFAQKIKPPK
jgi:Raf kinase inhibitor-like YbhB/YbcL family protein